MSERRGKRTLGVVAGLVLVAAAAGLWLRRDRGERLPNVLLVTCDTLRADRLHLYGASRATSPNLDALAAESVTFDRIYANSSFTPPSHASILTGRYVPSHGVAGWSNRLSPQAPTIAELLGGPRGLGYSTAAITNLDNFESLRLTRGFERVRSETAFPGDELNRDFFSWLDALGGADAPRFCAWLHYWDPHRPYGFRDWRWLDPTPKSPEERAALDKLSPAEKAVYDRRLRASKRPPLTFLEERFGKGELGVGREESHYDRKKASRALPVPIPGGASRVLTADDDRFLADRYDGGVLYLDRWLGALVAGLRERKQLDTTLLVITSDHGESFTERDDEYFCHDPHLFDEVTHVPLVMRFPGARRAGTRVAALGESVDLVPTVLDVLGRSGRSGAPSVQGTSLLPRIEGAAGPRYLHAQTQTEWTCELDASGDTAVIHSSTHRLVVSRKTGDAAFYDRLHDPKLATNLHADPPSEMEAHMRKRLDQWLENNPSGVKLTRIPAQLRRSVRTRTHLLIESYATGRVELYDLEHDPGATRDLHASPPGDVERELLGELRRFVKETPVANETAEGFSAEELRIMRGLGYN